ncbi:MAG TPA: alanine-zipper protein [Caulobacteraceae bacterium]|jgi:outer membrane murein-binding lipoprotein Lpp
MQLRTAIVRAAAVSAIGLALGLGACATPNYDDEFAMVNTRLDNLTTHVGTLDMRVTEAIQRADAAGQAANAAAAEARTANQRIDQLNMQRLPARSPRG